MVRDELKAMRKKIDAEDARLLLALGRRMRLSTKIGTYKRTRKLPALDEKRWKEMMRTRRKLGKKTGLSIRLIDELFRTIHKHSRSVQKSA